MDKKTLFLTAVFIGLFYAVIKNKSQINEEIKMVADYTKNLRRGERINNPLNIEKGEKWVGLADEQPDDRFAAFVSPEYGIRAFVRILNTYMNKHGLKTLRQIVNRYAPPSENNTVSYIGFVSKVTGIKPDAPLQFNENILTKLATAFINMEQGRVIYPPETIRRGVKLGMG